MAALAHDFSLSTTNLAPLAESTVFLKMTFSIMGNTRKVRETSDTGPITDTPHGFAVVTDADKRHLSHSKRLLDSPELEAIKTEDARFKGMIKRLCLPYDDGILLLPRGMIESVHPLLVEYHDVIRPVLVQSFLDAYYRLREDARISLGSLYSSRDYPSVEDIRERFAFTYNYLSFGVPGQLATISGSIYTEERDKQAAKWEQVTEQVTEYMRAEAISMVARLQDVLTPNDDGSRKTLYATAITNLQDFLATLSLRNVTNDTELDAAMARVRSLVDGANVDMLRLKSADGFREQIRSGLERVSGQLADMVTVRPARRFRD